MKTATTMELPFTVHRHRERGTFYRAFGYAGVQAARPIVEGDLVRVYLGEKGDMWVRPQDEFNDGRFEQLGDERSEIPRQRADQPVGAWPTPIPMRLHCPACHELHIDIGEFATKPHHTHACQSCGNVWRPAIVPTVGVGFLPGFKNDV